MNEIDMNDTTKIAKDKSISVDYSDTSVYYQQYRRTLLNGGYIDIPFSNPSNLVNPSLIYFSLDPTIKYKSDTLYIFKKSHLIKNIDYQGELVIKNVPMNADNGPVIYVCFPLKTNSKIKDTSIDKIIKMSEILQPKEIKTNININSMIDRSQKYIFYKEKNTIVVVFTNPIQVSSKFTDFYTCDLFSPYVDNYNILQNNPEKEGFVEGAGETTTTSSDMTCVPIEENGNDVLVSYLNTSNTEQNKTIDLLFSMIIFVILFCVAFFGSPFAYKSIFMNTTDINQMLGKTFGFSFFYIIFCIALIVGGFIAKDKNEAIAGIFLLIFYGISGLTVLNRWNTDTTYKAGLSGTINNAAIFTFEYLNEYLNYLKYYRKSGNISYERVWSFVAFVFIAIIPFLIAINVYNKGKNKMYIKNPEKRLNTSLMLGFFGIGYSWIFAFPFLYNVFLD